MGWLERYRAEAAQRMTAIRAGVEARWDRGREAVDRVAQRTRDAVVQTYEAGRALAGDARDTVAAAYDASVHYTSALVEATVNAGQQAYATASAAVRRQIDRLRVELQAMIDAAKALLQRMIAEAAALPGRVGRAIGARLDQLKREVDTFGEHTQASAIEAAGRTLDWRARRNTPRLTDDHFTADQPDPQGAIMIEGAADWPTSSPRPPSPGGSAPPRAPRTVYHYRRREAGSRAPSSPGVAGPSGQVLSPAEDSFIYMDVGKWGGSKAPGSDERPGSTFARSRDFGIICGHTAVLCQYGEGRDSTVSIGAEIPSNASNRHEADAINGFLRHLGDVKVVDQMRHHPGWMKDSVAADKIYVFLGDMHLPVTTRRTPDGSDTAAHGQMGRFEVDDALYRFAMEMELRTAAIIGAAGGGAAGALGTAPDSVLRLAGGAGLGALAEDRTGGNRALGAASGALATGGLVDMVRAIPGTVGGAVVGGAVAAQVWTAVQMYREIIHAALGYVPSHAPGGTFDAASWLQTYGGADIFEGAHVDLERFCNKIASWNVSHTPTVNLTQCGDMFDLWVGMLCFFADQPGHDPAPDTLWGAPSAIEFANYWVNSTVSSERAAGLGALLELTDKVLLYGNHDNMLASSVMTPPRQPPRDKANRKGAHFFAEHGHRTDKANGDGIRTGWAVTQLAFKYPIVRKVEPDGRADFLRGASSHWESAGPYLFYVMGHTHVPYLSKVILRNL